MSLHLHRVSGKHKSTVYFFGLSFSPSNIIIILYYVSLSLLYADTKFKCSDDQKGTLVSLYYDIETKIKSYVAGSQSVIVYGVIIFVVGLTGMLFLMVIVLLISYANRWNSKFNSEQGEAQLLVVRSI